ncbi:hypothetical protein [Planktotalea sp.]|uniref:hypothetical protein n=1 Tax=Planktotalea sp. TaxID=2029877 RepID=UPI003299096E
MAKQAYRANIAAIMLRDCPSIAIDLLADEILKSAVAQHAGSRSVTWDCDDLVFLDFDNLRIALYEIEATPQTPPFICLGVGSVPGHTPIEEADCSHISQELTQRLTQIVAANAVLWHDEVRALTADVMDDFNEALGKMVGYLDMLVQDASENFSNPSPQKNTPKAPEAVPKLNRPAALLKQDAALDMLREHLRTTGKVHTPLEPHQHLSMYVTAASLLLTLPALGSAVLSYIWLRNGLDKPSSTS